MLANNNNWGPGLGIEGRWTPGMLRLCLLGLPYHWLDILWTLLDYLPRSLGVVVIVVIGVVFRLFRRH